MPKLFELRPTLPAKTRLVYIRYNYLMRRFYYLGSLLTIFIVPEIVVGHFVISQIPLFNLIIFTLGVLLLGSIWDIWATRHGKQDTVWLWEFNHKDTIGVFAFGLPIEEYLFYVVSTLYLIFMWVGIQQALASSSNFLDILLPCAALYSLFAAMLPYWIKPKGDRL